METFCFFDFILTMDIAAEIIFKYHKAVYLTKQLIDMNMKPILPGLFFEVR